MEITELLDRAKKKADLASDYALAKAMGKHTGTVANWRKGKQHPSVDEAVQLATLAGLDEMRVIAEIELRTANTEKKKEFWKHYIESRGLASCLTMAGLTLAIIATPTPSNANVLQLHNYAKNNIHYAKYLRAIMQKLKQEIMQKFHYAKRLAFS